MQLYENHPYWLMKDGIVATYPSLAKDITIDVAIIGAGISGSLAAYYLRNTGLSIGVFDRRHAGHGSTAASTAFLQYEIDTPLTKLSELTGIANAVRSYELCRKAIYDIAQICGELKPAFDFHIRPSLQFASYKKHTAKLLQEYELRKKYGFEVSWLQPADIQKLFGFEAPGAILSADGGEVDAYLLTHALLATLHSKGHGVYSNTHITDIDHNTKGVTLLTDAGYIIKAKKLIIACGYESLKYVPKKIADIHTTYAIVSEPIADRHPWHSNSLVWETADPYLYFRMVNGDRVLVGGKDDEHHHPHIYPSLIKRKSLMLQKSFNKKMITTQIKADFSWCGAFAVTKDGLPFIGAIPERPHTHFLLGFGGNGITFSAIGAQLIRDAITGKKNADAHLFRFNR